MKKEWILTIGIDKYYLTTEEKEFYLTSVDNGSKYVVIESKYLGTNFQSLVNLADVEETKMIESGKWKCAYGKWHPNQVTCSCKYSYEIEGGKAIKTIDPLKQYV